MPYVKSMIFLNLAKKASTHALKARGKKHTRRALHLGGRLRIGGLRKRRALKRRLAGRHHGPGFHLRRGRVAGMRHAHSSGRGARHAFAHRKVAGHFTRRKHTERKRERGTYAKRRTTQYTRKRIVHKSYHHRNRAQSAHHTHRQHVGNHGRRTRRKKG